MGNRKTVLWDKSNRCYFQYLTQPDGSRKKVYLIRARSRTNDPVAKRQAVDKWLEIQYQNNLTPYKRNKKEIALSKLRARGWSGGRGPKDTIAGVITHHLYFLRKEVAAGNISEGYFSNRLQHLKYFQKWLGPLHLHSDSKSKPVEPRFYSITNDSRVSTNISSNNSYPNVTHIIPSGDVSLLLLVSLRGLKTMATPNIAQTHALCVSRKNNIRATPSNMTSLKSSLVMIFINSSHRTGVAPSILSTSICSSHSTVLGHLWISMNSN